MTEYERKIKFAVESLKSHITLAPRVGLVLGSGWNMIIENIENGEIVPYSEVPGMFTPTAVGHAGQWIFGTVSDVPVCVMAGRLHHYEGHDLRDVTFPIRVMKGLGVEIVLLTNAAGAVNTDFSAGDLMLITDHINMTGENPLIGANEDALGPRFPDMTHAYDARLLETARQVSRDLHFPVREGVYAWMTGPSFETPAEIRMLRAMGADAVGMSTVPEVIVANHAGMRVLGLSCMTNMAAGVLDQPLSHQEVLDTAHRVQADFRRFVYEVISRLRGSINFAREQN